MDRPSKVTNPARGRLNRENEHENLVSGDRFGRPVQRQPAHLHSQGKCKKCDVHSRTQYNTFFKPYLDIMSCISCWHDVDLLFVSCISPTYRRWASTCYLVYQSHLLQRCHPVDACGHEGSSHLFPVLAFRFFIAMQVQHSYKKQCQLAGTMFFPELANQIILTEPKEQ